MDVRISKMVKATMSSMRVRPDCVLRRRWSPDSVLLRNIETIMYSPSGRLAGRVGLWQYRRPKRRTASRRRRWRDCARRYSAGPGNSRRRVRIWCSRRIGHLGHVRLSWRASRGRRARRRGAGGSGALRRPLRTADNTGKAFRASIDTTVGDIASIR